MKLRNKYAISIGSMVVGTVLLWFGKLNSGDWVTLILGVISGITLGYGVKKVVERYNEVD